MTEQNNELTQEALDQNAEMMDAILDDMIPEEIEDLAFFGFIDEIAASLEDLTFPQLEQVRDFVYSLYTEGDDCGGCE